MVYNFFTSVLFLFYSFNGTLPKNETSVTAPAEVKKMSATQQLYNAISAHSVTMPGYACFEKAVSGFNILKERGKIKKDLLTVIDFSQSSNTKRLWVIDMATQTILLNTLVAHGRNSGDEFATSFSNADSSYKSSLGFYVTGEIYNGKHGESLKLDGLESGLNTNARNRGVVMHAAEYVSEAFIKAHRRLGRSQGCPALPQEITAETINLLKGKSCLFIYHPSYDTVSKILS